MTYWKSIGVTATREGLTSEQKQWVVSYLNRNATGVLHHGDCIGGDEELAEIFSRYGAYIIAHPSNMLAMRARSKYNDLTLPTAESLLRNRTIVQCSQLMLGFPKSTVEEIRSGTWYTIRYTKRENSKLIIVGPDGKVLNS
jgi:predicted alpha-1,6-mannanase (GH76 family)